MASLTLKYRGLSASWMAGMQAAVLETWEMNFGVLSIADLVPGIGEVRLGCRAS